MQRFHLDEAQRHLAGLAERTPQQKDHTDRVMRAAQVLAAEIDALRGQRHGEADEAELVPLAGVDGDPDEIEAALLSLDDAVAATFKAIVPAA